jgi:hypothetical protein
MLRLQLVTEFCHGGFSLALDVIQEVSIFLSVEVVTPLHDLFIQKDEVLILIQIFEEL